MVIILKNKRGSKRYVSTQFRYAITYLLSTTIALFVLNMYCSAASQRLFYQSKKTFLVDKTQYAARKISTLDILTPITVQTVVDQEGIPKITQMIITDPAGLIIYDSCSPNSLYQHASIPEIEGALSGNDVFTWAYDNGVIYSVAATPITSGGATIGCVYMSEHDPAQGSLMRTLLMTILTISVILEIGLFLFAWISSRLFSYRLHKIMNSMHYIQEGNYSSRVKLKGRDELTYLADEFNNLTSLLQISENKRSQFVSDASHELKTPLASIKLLSDSILQNDMDIETIKEFVADIGDEAERLNRMAQKLLDLTRGENNTEQDDLEVIYMAPAVDKVVHMLSPLAQSANVRIITQLEADSTVMIREGDLYRIIYNLVENGIKYNVPNGNVSISLKKNEEYSILAVADTGCGIPEEALSKIFERFYRVDKARSRESGGSGLGLSIVRNMVERNHGRIQVESKVGVGTVFTIEFPSFDGR